MGIVRRIPRTRTAVLFAAALVMLIAVASSRYAPSASRANDPPDAAMVSASQRLRVPEPLGPPPVAPSTPATDRERLLAAGLALVGTPYRWGAKGPDAYDCSGFTKTAYERIGVQLPDGSFNQAEGELPLGSIENLAPGDLLFYRWQGTDGVHHVTMYLGDGWAIGTGSPGQPKEVVVYPLASDLRHAPTATITYRHLTLPDGS